MPNGEQLSNKEFQWGYWYFLHKDVIKHWAVRILLVVNILLLGFSGVQLFRFFVLDAGRTPMLFSDLSRTAIRYGDLQSTYVPVPPEILSTRVLSAGKGKYDFVARVRNPNAQWLMRSIRYHFEAGGNAYPEKENFLFPGQERLLVDLNEEASLDPGGATFVLDAIDWQRVKDGGAYERERFQFETENVRFIPAQGQKESIGIGQTVLTLKNASAYNFWSLGVLVAAMQGSDIRAVNRVTIDHVLSHEAREVRIPWFEPLAGITGMDIAVEANVYDPNVFEEIRGGPPEQ